MAIHIQNMVNEYILWYIIDLAGQIDMAKIKYIKGNKYTLNLRGVEIKDIIYDGVCQLPIT